MGVPMTSRRTFASAYPLAGARRTLRILPFVSCLVVLPLALPARADVVEAIDVVDVCSSGCDHATIQGAIDGAHEGDVIRLAPGTYTEMVTVDKGVTITGEGYVGDATIDPSASGTALEITNDATVTVSALTITGADVGVHVSSGTAMVDDATLHDNTVAISVDDSAVVRNSDVSGNDVGIAVNIDAAEVEISGSDIRDNTDVGVWVAAGVDHYDMRAPVVVAHLNNIVGNLGFGVQSSNQELASDFENNWWGKPGGPVADGNNKTEYVGLAGDQAVGRVDYSPWCVTENCGDVDPTRAPVTKPVLPIGVGPPGVPALVTPTDGVYLFPDEPPVFRVLASDPDGDAYSATITVRSAETGAIVSRFETATAASGDEASGTPVPSLFPGAYVWSAWATDAYGHQGASSGTRQLTISLQGRVVEGLDSDIAFEVDDVADLAGFDDELRTALGERFGGSWGSEEDPSALYVGVVAPTEDDVSLVTSTAVQYEIPDDVHVEAVAYSEGTLTEIYEQIDDATDAIDPNTLGWFSLSLSLDLNQVVVEIESIEALAPVRALLGTFPEEAVDVVESSGTDGYGASRNAFPPAKAGLRVNDVSHKHVRSCTMGFVMHTGYPNQGAPVGTTAGHCTWKTGKMKTGERNVTTVGDVYLNRFEPWNTNATKADVALFTIGANAQSSNKLYVNPSLSRSVTRKVGRGDLKAKKTEICKSAYKTNVQCGTVTHTKVTKNPEFVSAKTGERFRKKVKGMACARIISDFGDSGGPLYIPLANSKAAAVGIHNVGIRGSNPEHRSHTACFTLVTAIEERANVILRTWS
jgi:hypothetical protein